MTDGVGKIHDASVFPGAAVKGDDGDILVFQGRSNQPTKNRFGTHLDEGVYAGIEKMFYRRLKLHRRG